MTCSRCGWPIDEDEPFDVFVPDTGSGVAPTAFIHRAWRPRRIGDRCQDPAVSESPLLAAEVLGW